MIAVNFFMAQLSFGFVAVGGCERQAVFGKHAAQAGGVTGFMFWRLVLFNNYWTFSNCPLGPS